MPVERDLVLGIDCSTTACKAIVWDRQGAPLAEGRAPLALSMPRPSWHEQDARQWWSATTQAVRAAVAVLDARRIAGLCIAHQRETFVPVDGAGRPLCPALVWMDERARDLLPVIERDIGRQAFHTLTGKPLSANLSLPKLLWLQRHQPDVLQRAAKVVDVHAFLAFCLTGAWHTSLGSADPMGMLDLQRGVWADDLLRLAGLCAQQMPELAPPGAPIGGLTAEAATRCGLPPGVPVIAGLGDGQAAGLGANVTGPGFSYLNLGTAVVSGAYAPSYVADPAFRTMFGGVPHSYLLETVILGGAYTVSWFASQFGEQGGRPGALQEEMDRLCGDIAPGSQGLLLVPYWNSAMNPYWDAGASGVVVGWRGVHGKAHLYRAILEGVAFEQRLHTEGVEACLGRGVTGYTVMGGGARSELWRQIIADVTGKPVRRSSTNEAAALGAAILACAATGLHASIAASAAAMTHLDEQAAQPDSGRHAVYTRLYEDVYRRLFPALQPYLDRLTELSEAAP